MNWLRNFKIFIETKYRISNILNIMIESFDIEPEWIRRSFVNY